MGKVGKVFVIDGVDSSGKEVQSEKLYARLKGEGLKVRKLSFPDYASDASALVKMYLKGEFGGSPGAVSPYVASTFYAVDRYASFKKDWEDFYNDSGILICDRYCSSNAIHQASKLHDVGEKDKFLNWLWDLEYNIYKIPVPDQVFFLDMPPKIAIQLMEARVNKIDGLQQKDIHEINEGFLTESYVNAFFVANKYSWLTVNCTEDEKLRTIETIHEELYLKLKYFLAEKIPLDSAGQRKV